MSANLKLVRVVTNRSRLMASRPGDPTFWDRVRTALAGWEAELDAQGMRMDLVLTDELVDGSHNAKAKRIRQHLVHLQEEEKADYTLILGGDRVVPFYRLPDPVVELVAEADHWASENDRLIYSDDPYASYEDTYLYKPKHPIGRFPNGQGQHDDLLVELLQRSTRYHRESWDSVRRVAFTTQSWQQQSRTTWPAVNHWYECPPWRLPSAHDPTPDHAISPSLLIDKTLHYYNLHGQKNNAWTGECACEWTLDARRDDWRFAQCQPPALSVTQIPTLPPAVIFSAACYGGFTTRPRPTRNMALRFLQQGAIAFIGATARAYTVGPLPGQPLRYSDLLAQTFLQLVEENLAASPRRRIGEIVQAVKNDYHLAHRFYQHPLDFKTLWEFVLYGDPTLIPFRRVETGEEV